MKTRFKLPSTLAAVLSVACMFHQGAPLQAAPFTAGNVVVYRVGDGAAANLINTGNPVFLDEYTPAGALVQSIAMPTAVNGSQKRLVASGTAGSEGLITRSADGQYLIATGYDATPPNATSLTSSASTAVNRVIARVDSNGVVDTTTALTDAATGNNVRSAAMSGSNFWICGGAGAVRAVAALGNTTSVDLTTASVPTLTNARQLQVFDNQLYVSSGSGTNTTRGVSTVGTGTPTSGTASVTRLPGLTDTTCPSSYGFFFADLDVGVAGYDTLYICDDTGTVGGVGGIQKYSLVSGSWVSNGVVGAPADAYRGMTGSVTGASVTLYVTRKGGSAAVGGGEIAKLTDTAGYNAVNNGTPTLVATAPTNTAFRGIAFAPSASLSAPLFTTHPSSQSISSGTTATMSVATSGNPAATYQWYAGISGDTSSPISGATGSSYTTPALTATTSYWVRATNSQGTADSNTATITVTQAPAITTQPVNQTIVSGGTVTLSVVATGIPAPTYQWYEGAAGVTTSPVSGATSASFTSAALSAGTSFWVRATNASGSADSSAAAVTVVSASPISGTNRNILIPNTGSWSTGGVTLNGSTFINLGLQGVGRIPASAKDAVTGESLGSISDMQVTAWKKNVDGSYSGTFHFLPDRGYNSGVIFSNYAARINTFDFTFTPYTAAGSTTAQNQIAMTFTGSTRFTYNNGSANIFTTGTLANGSATLFGTLNPITTGASTQSDGTYSNRLTADTEGLVLDRRPGKSGQGWIGDEYGASIYHFNASKQIDGQVILPPVYVPHSPVGTTNFAGTPTNGRRDNQGMEGIAQSPDGTKLFGLMQSALVHDSLTGNQGRFNTRLLVYDISSTDTPSDPIAQYVIQLPVADDTGSTTNGTTVNRNCAQSSILALNDHQILILARDGNGRGASGTPVFKSILLADLNGATNIDGTYDAEGNTIISGGALNPAITPLSWTEALNMIGKLGTATAAEVAKFGLNLNTAPGDINSICEKWEALALAPANDAANPNDYFLFVGNDNDFITATGKYMDATGTLQDYNAGLENDTIVLAWRVRMTSSDNQAPFVANNIPDQTATELSAFSFAFGAGTFADPESTTLTYTATKADDSPLPAWLSFNAGTRTFSGTPSLADVGTLNVKVTATDSGTPALSVSAPFSITVGAAPASFSFASATYSVVESAGNVTLTINRAGGQGATSINVSTTDGTALAGTDYTAQSNVAVNFAANQASATIDVPVVNRSGINASRSFTAALSGGTTTAPATTTVTITESESSFAFSASTASVSEAAGNVVLTINRTGRTDVANEVSVTTSNGTAIAGTDYTAQSGVAVNFAINDTSKTISIPVINRPGIRPSRTFSAALSVSGSPLLTGTPSSSTVTITEADTYGAMTGPSSSKTPYVQPLLSNWQTTALLSVGDQVTVSANAGSTPLVSGKYEMAGIPDGLGAFDNGDGTFTLLMHHEINNTLGVIRAHGSIGGFISEWIINKSTLQVLSGSDLIRNIYGWNTGTQSSNASPSAPGAFVFNRFCSADLPAPSALYNAATGLGTQERMFLGGEESGSNGWALATVASGANKGSSYLLGKFNLTTNGSGLTGVGGWENLLASPFAQDKTVVIGNNDGGTGIMANAVAVYVGTKTNSGSEADKAGLTNGTLKFVNVTGSTAEIVNTTTRATNITSGTAFTLSGTSSTVFSRPEDGAWDPTTPGRFYFVTTDRIDQVNDGVGSQIGRTRLWRLNFTDITNPDLGGTIDLLIEGGGTLPTANDANMFDNITVTNDGKVVLCEDVGGAAHNGKVWFYDPATGTLTKVLKHDIARFGDVVSGTVTAATTPFNNDEETSGVIDVTAIFGGNSATGERTYLLVDQAHYTTGVTAAQVEGGQLLLVKQAATFLGVAAGDASSTDATLWAAYNKTTTAAAINVQVATDLAFSSPTTTASSVPASTNGWTTKITVTGLAPATTYFYRFVEVATGEISNTGKFKTAPSITSAAALHFAFSGDNDGLIRPYPLASVVPSQNLDFYINLGDVIYENASNVAGNNGASWLNSPSVTLSNDALNFNGVPRAFIPSGTPFATQAQLFADYTKKYKENFLPVNIGGQNSLKDFYAGQGNYTTWDNHELGNRKYIDGGAPAGGSVGGAAGTDMATGRGVDARDNGAGNVGNVNDVNTSTTDFMNRSTGFQTLRDVFLQWQPIADRGTITAPADPRTDGSKQLYSAQRWGKNALLINTDTRSYRDIRLKTATANADDTGARADNASRTFLGTTQLAWLKQTLLDAQNSGVVWKFITLSDPIDQIGPVGGALSLTNLPSFGAGSTYAPVNADGGKAYIGGYRAERNALLKYIADNKISNVVFLSTDDHQNRINEITYSPSGRTGPGTSGFTQSDYIKVPYCFSIVCGPLGATGPDLITNHSFSMAKQLADSIVAAQTTAGVEPLGLVGYPGLKNLVRENDPTAGTSPQAVDFYSPDTFNFTTLDVSADGKTLTVASIGMDATAQNSATEYSSSRTIFSFQIDGVSSNADLGTLALGGGVTLSPAFDPAVTAYTANVAGNVTSMTITPTSSDAGATITVNGNALVSGSATVPLNVGANTITVLVTAADGNTKTYTITVTRAAAPSFAFAASTYSVSESAGNSVLSITRGGDATVAVSVVVNTANGSGVSGIDYTAVTAQTVNFAANATTATVNVPLLFRSGIQPSRTFTATLSSPSSGTVLGSPTTTTVTITEADTYGAMTGPSSSKTPYVQPLMSNWQTTALLSVGDQVTVSANAGGTPLVGGKYEMAGIPDGLGAFDNGDGTFTLLMHHEINNALGVTRAHGSIGGFISEWIINKSTLQVVSGSDLIRSIYGWNTGTQSSNASPSAAGAFVFNRFCSADLPAPSALYNAATGLGTQERVFLGGEESGSNGWALATVASGANKGSSYLLGKFNLTTNGSGLTGVGGWENLLASPFAQDKTVVIGNNDGGTGIMANAVAVYVGTKTNSGSEADKAGLTNGTLKFVNVTGNAAEIANTTTRATNITSGTPFTLSGTSSTVFSRPEDGAWDPTTPGRFYFVTTDRIDQVNDGVGSQIGRTRLWRLNFTDITNPDLGGTIDLVLTGGVGNDANMWDNMCVTADGKIVLCEDVGGAAHNGKVWFYDPATSTLTKVLKHDIARFGDVVSGTVTAATVPFNNDEETSGVIDVTAIFGGNAVIGNRYYLLVDQAHYTTGITAAQVEGGQLLLVRQTPTSSSLSTTTTPYLLPLDASYSTKSLLAVGDQVTVSANAGSTPLVGGKYEMAGIPDGLGAFDNGDGTLTLLMHHELNNTVGVTRAHGSIGAFISEWIINKSTLQVVSGSDLIRNVYGWNTGTQSSNASPAAAGAFVFNRFCSADLPAPSALYNAATGLGTQERVFLGGEESGSNGWALATVASGANKGSSYVLGKFNLTTNGSGLTGVGGWENLLASPFAQDKTVVIGNNDGGTGIMANAVAVYVGTKTNTGTEADKAGLTNGALKFVNVSGNAAEIVNTTTRATNITSGTAFTLSGTSSTVFSRPEDGAWDPTTPGRFYFVTTDRIDQVNDGVGSQIGRTRLWRLNFTDITNPDLGGTIDLVLTGGVGNDANMWDNMCVAYDGKVMLQEDVGGAAHNGKIWSYDPVTNTLTKVVTHDPARFGDILPGGTVLPAVSPFSNDEESSGIIDVTSLLGGNAAAGEHIYFTVCQAHYTTGITAAQVEGGQLLVIRETPRVAFSLAASTNTVNENAGSVMLTVNRFGDLQFGGTATVTTANGTALAGTDYTALSAAPLSFLPGETSKTINVTIANRLGLGSATRTFTARVAGEATGTPALTTVTINSVAPPTVSIANASVAEGNAGTSTLSLNVTRSDTSTAFTVNYAVTGGTATSGTDYVLTPGTLTFASGGPATQTIDITVNGDTTIESNENVLVTLSGIVNTTGTTVLGTAVGTGTITNDDTVPNSFPASGTITSTVKGSIGLSGAEIPAFDPVSKRAFASSNNGIQVVNLTNPASPAFITVIAPSSLGVSGLTSNDVSSVAVRKGSGSNPSILAAGIISVPKTSPGYVVFLNAATGALIGSTQVGANPDHIAFTPDGTKLLVANEGETAGNVNLDTTLGTVSIIAVDAAGVPGATHTADFTAYDAPATITALRAAGVRIFQGGVPSTDFEPEYFAVTADNTKALVTLQEANAIAVLDLATATFTSVVPLGKKNFATGRHDFSDRDGVTAAGAATTLINPTTGNPVFGLYMPDGIASYTSGGQSYFVTANEGDDRNDFITPAETTTVSNAAYVLDPTVFPNATTLKNQARLGRLTVCNAPGLRGDTDNDGDIDEILSYGGRSFSILDAAGNIIFDSGDMIENIVASQFPANFDDTRSDNKGPEPEGVTIATLGARTYAFIGLERSHMTLMFDVTNPAAVTFTGGFVRSGDLNPEGLVFVSAADSPSGKPLLLQASEVSNTLTVFEINQTTDYTLQVLHYYGESGLLGIQTAPIMGAMIDRFDDQYANTLVLAEGDSFIPGPWLIAGADPSLSAVAGIGSTALGRPDFAIMNAFGTDASALGNHEFDLGSPVLSGAFFPSGAWGGAQFPFITANLDFTGDSSLKGRADTTLGGTGGAIAGSETTAIKAKIAPYAVQTISGQKIGIVGATTWDLLTKTSPNGTVPKDDANAATSDLQEVAAYLQGAINSLQGLGVNKIILVDQLDTLQRNKDLAGLVSGIDIMVAGGGHERMGDANDVAVGFNGHDADFIADAYPIVTAGADGKPTLIVTTDTEFTYLGRLVVDFDADGVLILPNLNNTINGAYASTEASLQAAYATTSPAATIIAGSTIGTAVQNITNALNSIVVAKDSSVYGYTDVYLEGDRVFGRTQEVNQGNITADANAWKARTALGLSATDAVFSLKNGGGIRASLGSVLADGTKVAPLANPITGKPAKGISLLDIENALRFDNKLMAFDTTPAGLLAILNYAAGLSSGPTVQNGGYPQVGNIRFSYDSSLPAGSKVRSVALVNDAGHITARIVENGAVLSSAPATIACVSLNFTANGGDGYPIKANADNFRYLLTDGTLSAPVSEALDFTAAANVPANALGEQKAFSDYLVYRHPSLATAYNVADTPVAQDTRIQQLAFRTDNVLSGLATFAAWLLDNGFTGTLGGDSDNDGVSDALEYFFNTNPNNPADRAHLPAVVREGGDLEFRFTRLQNSTLNGTLRYSTDLLTWQNAVQGVDFEIISQTVSSGEVSVRYRILNPINAKFFQLRVE